MPNGHHITSESSAIDDVILGRVTPDDQVSDGVIEVGGDAGAFSEFRGMLDDFDFWFDIVTP